MTGESFPVLIQSVGRASGFTIAAVAVLGFTGSESERSKIVVDNSAKLTWREISSKATRAFRVRAHALEAALRALRLK